MQTEVFLLADHAQISEGKLYLSGAGWNHLAVDHLPIRRRVGLAIGFGVGPDDAGKRHFFRINMRTPGGLVEIGGGQFEAEHVEGPNEILFFAINADLPIESPGGYDLILSTNDNENKHLGFQVAAPPAA